VYEDAPLGTIVNVCPEQIVPLLTVKVGDGFTVNTIGVLVLLVVQVKASA
jgi:hypothetical protein